MLRFAPMLPEAQDECDDQPNPTASTEISRINSYQGPSTLLGRTSPSAAQASKRLVNSRDAGSPAECMPIPLREEEVAAGAAPAGRSSPPGQPAGSGVSAGTGLESQSVAQRRRRFMR